MYGQALSPGTGCARVSLLEEPLSFWGGFDVGSGEIVDARHPQLGLSLKGGVLVMERGRGSSSGSSVLAEAIRSGTAPVAIVMAARDEIVALGAIVADEVYGIRVPVVVLDPVDYKTLRVDDVVTVTAEPDGRATVEVAAQAHED